MNGQQCSVGSQLLRQHGSPPIDESLGQPGMQGIGKPGLYGAGASCHLVPGKHPVGTLSDIGPATDCGDPALQGVDIARGIVEPGNGLRDEIASEHIVP